MMSLKNGDQKDFEQKRAEEERKIDESLEQQWLVKLTPIEENILVTFNPKIDCLLEYFLDTDFLQKQYKTHYNKKTNTYRFTRKEFQELIYEFNIPFLQDEHSRWCKESYSVLFS